MCFFILIRDILNVLFILIRDIFNVILQSYFLFSYLHRFMCKINLDKLHVIVLWHDLH